MSQLKKWAVTIILNLWVWYLVFVVLCFLHDYAIHYRQ